MDNSITTDQFQNYDENVRTALAIYGREEASDPLARQWNEAFVEHMNSSQCRHQFKGGLECLYESFAEYRESSLSKIVSFKDFYEVLKLSEECLNEHRERDLWMRGDYGYNRERGRQDADDFKDTLLPILQVSPTIEDIVLTVSRLFRKHQEYQNDRHTRRNEVSFADYMRSLEPTKDLDIVNVVRNQKAFSTIIDDLRLKEEELLNEEARLAR